jgi:hypothetical protein
MKWPPTGREVHLVATLCMSIAYLENMRPLCAWYSMHFVRLLAVPVTSPPHAVKLKGRTLARNAAAVASICIALFMQSARPRIESERSAKQI